MKCVSATISGQSGQGRAARCALTPRHTLCMHTTPPRGPGRRGAHFRRASLRGGSHHSRWRVNDNGTGRGAMGPDTGAAHVCLRGPACLGHLCWNDLPGRACRGCGGVAVACSPYASPLYTHAHTHTCPQSRSCAHTTAAMAVAPYPAHTAHITCRRRPEAGRSSAAGWPGRMREQELFWRAGAQF